MVLLGVSILLLIAFCVCVQCLTTQAKESQLQLNNKSTQRKYEKDMLIQQLA